jgi:hypothetical protein
MARLRHSTWWQWTTLAAVGGSALALLLLAPESWNGGGGPVGNRYFLSIYPAMLFLLPSGAGLSSALVAAAGGIVFLAPTLLHPFAMSRSPWLVSEQFPLRLLPVELTLMNDLPVYLNIARARVLVNADPVVFFYRMDSRAYDFEPPGFWTAPGITDVVVRTEQPLTMLQVRVTSRIDNEVEIAIGGRSTSLAVKPGEERVVKLYPEPGVFARQSYQIVLRVKTARGFQPSALEPGSRDARVLGVFLSPTFEGGTR